MSMNGGVPIFYVVLFSFFCGLVADHYILPSSTQPIVRSSPSFPPALPETSFEFTAAETALANEALDGLPPDLLRIDDVRNKLQHKFAVPLTLPEVITLGTGLSRLNRPEATALMRKIAPAMK